MGYYPPRGSFVWRWYVLHRDVHTAIYSRLTASLSQPTFIFRFFKLSRPIQPFQSNQPSSTRIWIPPLGGVIHAMHRLSRCMPYPPMQYLSLKSILVTFCWSHVGFATDWPLVKGRNDGICEIHPISTPWELCIAYIVNSRQRWRSSVFAE